MSKKLYIVSILFILFCACDPEARWETEDVTITMEIKNLSAGFIECEFSTDKEAYYLIAIDSVRHHYDPMEHQKQFMTLALDSANLTYIAWRNKLLQDGEFNIAPFASHALQYGRTTHFFTSLIPNTDYWIYAFVVNPETMKPIGKLHLMEVTTAAESTMNIRFHYRVKGNWDYVYPLDSNGHVYSRFPYIATTRDSMEIVESQLPVDTYFDAWMHNQFTSPQHTQVYYGVKAMANDGISSHTAFEKGKTYYTAIGGFDGSIKQKIIYKFTWLGEETDLYFSEEDAIQPPSTPIEQ